MGLSPNGANLWYTTENSFYLYSSNENDKEKITSDYCFDQRFETNNVLTYLLNDNVGHESGYLYKKTLGEDSILYRTKDANDKNKKNSCRPYKVGF